MDDSLDHPSQCTFFQSAGSSIFEEVLAVCQAQWGQPFSEVVWVKLRKQSLGQMNGNECCAPLHWVNVLVEGLDTENCSTGIGVSVL